MLTFTVTLPSAFSEAFKRKARRYWATDGGAAGAAPFPTAAETFVRGEGAVVAAVLREKVVLPFAEIVTACREYVLEPPRRMARPLIETGIAVALLRLLDWGMARLIVD